MTPERLAQIHEADRRDHERGTVAPSQVPDIVAHRTELLAALDESYEAYEKLSVIAGRVDFDSTESACPETQEHWIEFIRSMQDALEGLVAPWDLGTVHDPAAVPSGTEEASESE